MISKEFVTAGNAIFTVKPPEAFTVANDTPSHWTFKVRHKEASESYGEAWFVSLLTGPCNESDYSYVGMLDARTGAVRLTAKSCLKNDSWAYKALSRVLAKVWTGVTDAITSAGWTLNHEGRCGRCGRLLTTPESCALGLGPECLKKM